jgi:histone H2B
MAKTPSKKSAKAPKKVGESKKPRKKTESYSTYIYRVLKQAPFGVLFLVARH